MNCFPFEDPVIVVRVKGKAIREALENSVALVPALEGRYSQVAGIRFCYNASFAPGSRVKWVEVANAPLDEEHSYTMATRGYMGRGKDGFTSLLVRSEGGEAEELVSEENGILISMILRQYFMSLKVLRRWRRWGESLGRHWGGVHEKLHGKEGSVDVVSPKGHRHTKNGSLKDGEETDEEDEYGVADAHVKKGEQERRETYLARWAVRQWMDAAGIKREDVGIVEDHDMEDHGLLPDWTRGIAPRVEGRIIIEDAASDGKVEG